MQVVNQLQSGSKSKRDGWRTELPKAGLGGEVLEKMKDEKRNDVAWKGKCSGTVYVCYYWMQNYVHNFLYKKILTTSLSSYFSQVITRL